MAVQKIDSLYFERTSLRQCILAGQWDQGAIYAKRIVEHEPGNGFAWYELSICLSCLGNLPDAYACAEKAQQLCPDHAWDGVYSIRGGYLMLLERYQEAVNCYDSAIAISPSVVGHYCERGRCLARLNRFRDAVADLTIAVNADYKLKEALLIRGQCYHAVGETQRAISDFDRLLSRWQEAAGYLYRGKCHRTLDDISSAMADFSQAIRLDHSLAEAYFCRADIHAAQLNPECAMSDVEKAIELNPRHARALTLRGKIHGVFGRIDQSLADFARAIELDPRLARAYSCRATVYVSTGLWQKADADLRIVAELSELDDVDHLHAGICALKLGDTELALNHSTESMDRTRWPDVLMRALLLRIDTLIIRKEWEEAFGCTNELLRLSSDGGEHPVELCNVRHRRGVIYHHAGDNAKAIEELEACVAFGPRQADAYYSLGLCYKIVERWTDAIRLYSEALRLSPNDANILASRGDCYSKMDRFDEALADLNRAVELDPDSPVHRIFRAQVYFESDAFDEDEILGELPEGLEETLADLNEAIALLSMQDTSAEHDRQMRVALRLRATCYEEMGESEKATEDRQAAEAYKSGTDDDDTHWWHGN